MAATPKLTKNLMAQPPLNEKASVEFVDVDVRDGAVDSALLENARRHSQAWVLAEKSTDKRVLWTELKKIRVRFAAARKRTSSRAGEQALPDFVRRPLEQGRVLFQSALMGIEDAIRPEEQLQQITGDGGQLLPRAYVAAKDYLDAVQMDFQENSCLAYLQTVEKAGIFEMGEIWLLSSMLQLHILAEVSQIVQRPNGELPADSGERIEQLAAILVRVQKASWKTTFQSLSVTEAILCEDPVGAYAKMDFRNCGSYRDAVEELSKYSGKTEDGVARIAVSMARAGFARFPAGSRLAQRHGHVGYYLVDKGRVYLEKEIGYRPQGMAFVRAVLLEAPALFYFLGVEFCIFAILLFILSGISVGVPFVAATLLFLLPVSEAAVEVINPFILFLLPPRVLPRMDFSRGIPEECTTVVAVPTLLISKDQVQDLVRSLEIRYLGNVDPNLYFALLTDPPDSAQAFDEKDELVAFCSNLIEQLNAKYGQNGSGSFFLLHRNRTFNETEQTWMGWERKRGKLLDFNELLRGGQDSFPVKVGDVSRLKKIRYVITLDSDTQLPRDSAKRLVGAMAHPLNQALIDPHSNTVREGYGVLQPRVGISVNSVNRSRLAYIYSGQTGLDIYTNAVSDVYQDLFAEGIFTGKGIYEVDVFRQVLGKRFPSNAILSHDLIEGAYSRTGLLTEVEIIDDYPSHFSAHSRRKHRWVRGDWQILRWLFNRVPDANGQIVDNPLSFVSRWKILDNLRRSVIEAATFILFLACWFVLPGSAARWTIAALALLLIPSYLQAMLSLMRHWSSPHRWAALGQVVGDFETSQVNVLVFLAFLPHQAMVTLDAIVRTVFRLTVTKRKLLEWETAAQSEMENKKKTPVDRYLEWTPLIVLLIACALAYFRPASLLVASPILFLWLIARLATKWLDRPLRSTSASLSESDERYARKAALKTWRYFSEYSNAEQNWLVPDNIQGGEVASRISTTNLGMLFNAQYAAYHLGVLTLPRFANLAEQTMATAKKLERFHGQMVNWYDTRTLAPLAPLMISSVDNGNLVCSLWALKHGCLSAVQDPIFSTAIYRSITEHLDLALDAMKQEVQNTEAIASLETARMEWSRLAGDIFLWMQAVPKLSAQIDVSLAKQELAAASESRWWLAECRGKALDLVSLAESVAPWLVLPMSGAKEVWPQLFDSSVLSKLTLENYSGILTNICKKAETVAGSASVADIDRCIENVERFRVRLRALANDADELVNEMDFSLFYSEAHKALSVGYEVAQERILPSFYDLLASEARSAVFVAIAKNDIPQEAWFSMGRTHIRYAKQNVLLSWTGTMFEYLMPALWIKHFPSTLLEDSLVGAVQCQKAYVERRNIPWGISEGASIRKNDSGHFEYYAFGIPPLALKVSPPARIVITPYAAALALGTNPTDALKNLREMDSRGWAGRYGFYESAEYVPGTVVHESHFDVVPSWMAHHQGMILLSICNLLSGAVFQELFHAEVRVAATERILHERPLSAQAAKMVMESSPDGAGATA
jgi:cyclic beta-1,2-glucan synthetase